MSIEKLIYSLCVKGKCVIYDLSNDKFTGANGKHKKNNCIKVCASESKCLESGVKKIWVRYGNFR